MSRNVERRPPSRPAKPPEPASRDAAVGVQPTAPVGGAASARPTRRRRSAVLAGGALIAASPVAVAGGLLVPGFAALALGGALLLLPPRARRRRALRAARVLVGAARAAGAAGGRASAHARPRRRAGRRDRAQVSGAVHRQRGPRDGGLDRTNLRRGAEHARLRRPRHPEREHGRRPAARHRVSGNASRRG